MNMGTSPEAMQGFEAQFTPQFDPGMMQAFMFASRTGNADIAKVLAMGLAIDVARQANPEVFFVAEMDRKQQQDTNDMLARTRDESREDELVAA
jgi:hypothetical protein